MARAQANGVAFVIFAVIVVGFLLFIFYPSLETIRLNAIVEPENISQPFVMLVLYSLQPILWGIWFIASIGAVIFVARSS